MCICQTMWCHIAENRELYIALVEGSHFYYLQLLYNNNVIHSTLCAL
jgi:hypothetical protein